MNKAELDKILEQHELWLCDRGGERANLQGADLIGANLQGANLIGADLRYTFLQGAGLIGADFDFSCMPLHCGGLNMKIDDRFAKQLLYHVLNNVQYSPYVSDDIKSVLLADELIDIANTSHIVTEHTCNELKKSAPAATDTDLGCK